MNLFSNETLTIVKRESGKFTSANYTTKIKEYGGFGSYVKSLGGVFAKYYGKSITATTVTQFNEICEYVFGLMYIFRFCYWNGKTWWYWLNSSSKAFYSSKQTGSCRGGTISQLCQGTDGRTRITNCNYGVDTLLKALGLYKKSSDAFTTWATSIGKPIANKKDIKEGDILHFFGKSLDRTKPSTWKGKEWHHVVMVYKVENKKIWCLDFGNRFIKSGNPLHYMPVDSSAKAGGEYGSYYWAGIHAFDFKDDTKKDDSGKDDVMREKTVADKAVELKLAIDNFLAVQKTEYGEEAYDLAIKYQEDRDNYLRACADYVFEGFSGSGEARKVFFGADYDDAQAKVTWVWKVAQVFKNDADQELLKQILGADYEVVKNEVDRLGA